MYQSNNLPSINSKDIVNIFIFTSSWTTLSFERASIMTTWDPSCQQLGLLPHTYSQALLVPITIDPMKIANFFGRDPILITHLSLSIHYRKGEGRWSSISSYSPMLWVCFRTNVIGYYVFHPSHHPSEGNLKFKQWSITSKPTTGSSNIEGQLGYSTKYKETTSRSTSQCNALWRGGLGYFEATSIETCIPQVIKGGQKNSTQVLWSLQGVVEY